MYILSASASNLISSFTKRKDVRESTKKGEKQLIQSSVNLVIYLFNERCCLKVMCIHVI